MTAFFKFPSTPHLYWLGEAASRDDKVLSPEQAASFLAHPLVVEEKVDGANVGFSFSADGELRVQNRGQYLSEESKGQFNRVWQWIQRREDALLDALADRLILFGEWCYARHSLGYNHLPDWFLGFDVYDRSCRKFWSSRRRDELLSMLSLKPVPRLGTGQYHRETILAFLDSTSQFADARVEGIYLRYEDAEYLEERAKIVNAGFVQGIGTHWSRAPMMVNECRTTYG